MLIEIKNCSECPFLNDTFPLCELKPLINGDEGMSYDDMILDTANTPEYCPIKNKEISFKLKQ